MIYVPDLAEPEGPVLLPDGSWLVVEMDPSRGCITRLSADGKSRRVVAKTGRPNGLAVDQQGTIWVAESSSPVLLRMTMDGKPEVYLTGCEGEPFLFPNDLCFGPDGALYMTDSGITIQEFAPGGRIRSDYLTAPMDGRVYRIDTHSAAITKLDTGIRFTNGIAWGPDDFLYVNETITGMVYRYRSLGKGRFGPREDFGNVNDPALPGYKGPDGMKFGSDGNLYVTVYAQGDVTVLGRDGRVVRRIKTAGKKPTNVAFGPAGQKTVYVTEVELGSLEAIQVDTDGLPLYQGL
jgi:gluconolactonase